MIVVSYFDPWPSLILGFKRRYKAWHIDGSSHSNLRQDQANTNINSLD